MTSGTLSILISIFLHIHGIAVLHFFLLLHLRMLFGTREHGSRTVPTLWLSGVCGHRSFLSSSLAASSQQFFRLYTVELRLRELQQWISTTRQSLSTIQVMAKLQQQARLSMILEL